MSQSEEHRAGHAKVAWQTLLRAARSAHLHDPTHSLVQRMLGELVSRVRLAAGLRQPVDFDIGPRVVTLEGRSMAAGEQEPDPLVLRLHVDGVRRLRFRSSFDLFSASRLVELLAPFFAADPPVDAIDRLRWQAFEGLAIDSDATSTSDLGTFDVLTAREADWLAWLRTPPDPASLAELPAAALASTWDGGGGAIPWPIQLPSAELRALEEELEQVREGGVPLSRVGAILPDALEASRDTDRLRVLLDALGPLADQFLSQERIADLPQLLQPLARWTDAEVEDGGEDPLRDECRLVLEDLSDDRRLGRLLAAIQGQRLPPAEAGGWFLASPATSLTRAFEFAAAVPRGAYREAICAAAMTVAGPRYLGIAEVLRHSALGPALLSLEAIIDREPTREGLALALLALDRPEPVLRARAARYLMPWQSTSIGRRMVTLLHETNRELRSLALAWVARYQWQPALESLRALVTAAQFGHLPLAERVEATRTFGVVAGTSAVDVALRHLPHGWEHGELDRAVPWVSCLAATGLDEAEAPLDTLLAVAGGAVAQFAQDAVALWRRRRVELEAGIEGPAPAGAPATAGLRPQSVPAAAVPRRSYGRVPGERT